MYIREVVGVGAEKGSTIEVSEEVLCVLCGERF
jgi:hypothetical protein